MSTPEAVRLVKTKVSFEAPLLAWLAVHGNLCLALRHPANKGASRLLVLEITKEIGRALVKFGVVTKDQLAQAYHLETEEGSRDFSEEGP